MKQGASTSSVPSLLKDIIQGGGTEKILRPAPYFSDAGRLQLGAHVLRQRAEVMRQLVGKQADNTFMCAFRYAIGVALFQSCSKPLSVAFVLPFFYAFDHCR